MRFLASVRKSGERLSGASVIEWSPHLALVAGQGLWLKAPHSKKKKKKALEIKLEVTELDKVRFIKVNKLK